MTGSHGVIHSAKEILAGRPMFLKNNAAGFHVVCKIFCAAKDIPQTSNTLLSFEGLIIQYRVSGNLSAFHSSLIPARRYADESMFFSLHRIQKPLVVRSFIVDS